MTCTVAVFRTQIFNLICTYLCWERGNIYLTEMRANSAKLNFSLMGREFFSGSEFFSGTKSTSGKAVSSSLPPSHPPHSRTWTLATVSLPGKCHPPHCWIHCFTSCIYPKISLDLSSIALHSWQLQGNICLAGCMWAAQIEQDVARVPRLGCFLKTTTATALFLLRIPSRLCCFLFSVVKTSRRAVFTILCVEKCILNNI